MLEDEIKLNDEMDEEQLYAIIKEIEGYIFNLTRPKYFRAEELKEKIQKKLLFVTKEKYLLNVDKLSTEQANQLSEKITDDMLNGVIDNMIYAYLEEKVMYINKHNLGEEEDKIYSGKFGSSTLYRFKDNRSFVELQLDGGYYTEIYVTHKQFLESTFSKGEMIGDLQKLQKTFDKLYKIQTLNTKNKDKELSEDFHNLVETMREDLDKNRIYYLHYILKYFEMTNQLEMTNLNN